MAAEKTITITLKKTNHWLCSITEWRSSYARNEMKGQIHEILVELTREMVPWDDILRTNTRERESATSHQVSDHQSMLNLAVRLGIMAARAGWNMDDPRSVYPCGLYGMDEVDAFVARAQRRVGDIDSGRTKFAPGVDAEARIRKAREQLLLADNAVIGQDPPGYKQVVAKSLQTYVDENPELQVPGVHDFFVGLLNVKDLSRGGRPANLRVEMFKVLESNDFESASTILEQISHITSGRSRIPHPV